MFSTMTIQNYRVFRDFALDQTARVNLIVGGNNAGKSSLLEAIYLLTSDDPSSSLLYILSERGEFVSSPNIPPYDVRFIGGYLTSHIFHGHQLDADYSIAIKSHPPVPSALIISVQDVRSKRKRTGGADQLRLMDDEDIEISSRTKQIIFDHTKPGQKSERDSLITADGVVSFRDFPRRISPPKQASRLVTTNHLAYADLASLWDTITLTPREDKVVEALQILEPEIERISFTSRQNSASGILLKFRGESLPIPLSSMGEGLRRVLAVVASLVSVEAGTLLVDEIDTGLHYGVLKDMWRLIFEMAMRDNAQVFATTHSWDCVRAFQQALCEASDQDVGRLIRLERGDRGIKAVGYAPSELDIAIRQGIEVR